MNPQSIFDFSSRASLENWYVLNDGVMGGLSRGNLTLDTNGHGVVSGPISLENNGGFSALRYDCGVQELGGASRMVLRVKGDGKRYQFRIKSSRSDYYSYISYFQTDETWQDVHLALNDMYAVFRGRRLKMPNFNGSTLEEIGILIGNKEAETFELLIDEIRFE